MDEPSSTDIVQSLSDTLLMKAADIGLKTGPNEIGVGLVKEQYLPELSRARYEEEYNKFCEWCKVQNVKPSQVNDEVLLVYLSDKSKGMKPSTLWSIFSMIKTCLKTKEKLDNLNFPKTTQFLKQRSSGYKPQKTSVFTPSELTKFMVKAPDKDWLLYKVILVLFVYGACRREELLNINVGDVKDSGSFLTVFLKDIKSKKEKFNRRSFTITNEGCLFQPCNLIRKYLSLRPPHMEGKRLLIAYRRGKCVAQNVGCNTVSGAPKKVAEYLKLRNPNSYKAKGMRLTSVLMGGGGDFMGKDCLQGCSSNRGQHKILKQHCKDGIFYSDDSSGNEELNPKVPASFAFLDVKDGSYLNIKEETQGSETTESLDDDLTTNNVEVEVKIEEGSFASNVHCDVPSTEERPSNLFVSEASTSHQRVPSPSHQRDSSIKQMNDICEDFKSDESEWFGAYVASSLRALKYESSRTRLKSLIHNAIKEVNNAEKMLYTVDSH